MPGLSDDQCRLVLAQLEEVPAQRLGPGASPALRSGTVRIGLHGRNAVSFDELDFQLIREARIETLKMMSRDRESMPG